MVFVLGCIWVVLSGANGRRFLGCLCQCRRPALTARPAADRRSGRAISSAELALSLPHGTTARSPLPAVRQGIPSATLQREILLERLPPDGLSQSASAARRRWPADLGRFRGNPLAANPARPRLNRRDPRPTPREPAYRKTENR
jgi:hypothetical protein